MTHSMTSINIKYQRTCHVKIPACCSHIKWSECERWLIDVIRQQSKRLFVLLFLEVQNTESSIQRRLHAGRALISALDDYEVGQRQDFFCFLKTSKPRMCKTQHSVWLDEFDGVLSMRSLRACINLRKRLRFRSFVIHSAHTERNYLHEKFLQPW